MSNYISSFTIALFSLAKEEEKLKKYKKDSINLVESFSHNINYVKIMDSKNIDLKLKHKLIFKAFEKKIEKNIFNFIKLLVDKSKTRLILPILTKLIKLINNELNIDEGVIYTIKKITSSELKKIEKSTSKKLGHKISLKNKIDKELISGFKIVWGDKFIEDTVLSRLKKIKYKLLNQEGDVDAS